MMAKVERIVRLKLAMRRCLIGWLVAMVIVVVASPMASAAPRVTEPTVYVVAWGDTLSSIALRYGTTAATIAERNQVANPDLIRVGQRLVIPGSGSSAPSGSGTYTVRRGDTLSAIAVTYHTTIHELARMNGLGNPNLIYVGQRLAVPQGGSVAQPGDPNRTSTTYRVQRGDTLIGIAARFAVSMWDIVVANNIANPSLIYAGQTLTIPGADSPSEPTPTPLSAATPTTVRRSPTPTARRPTPTPTTATSYGFRYVEGSMRAFPNCGAVYFKGKITGVGGEPVNGRTVRLRFAGNVVYKVSGEGEDPGQWGFAPLAPENYHSPLTFLIDMVESPANPVPQSDTVRIDFTDCGAAGQFENIVFAYSATTAPTPAVSPTTVAPQNPTPTPTATDPVGPVEWDPRLNHLPCVDLVTVQERGLQLSPGDRYWRLVRARWLNEDESRRDIQIYVDLLDEQGRRTFGDTVVFTNGGTDRVVSEPQSCCPPWDYPVRWPMFNVLCSYSAYVEGLPSDMVVGMGLGTPEHPDWTIHTGFVLTFQRTVY